MSPRKRILRNLLVASAVLVLLVGGLYVFRTPILTGVGKALVVNDEPHPADMIFLLNGSFDTRPFRAAELYKAGLAPIVAITRCESSPAVDLGLIPNSMDISVGVLKKLGVPSEKIVILPFPGGATSTFDEASALKQYVQANDIHKIILVTSAIHTRRAKWIIERELAGLPVTLEVVAVGNPIYDETNWWKSEAGLIDVNNEYIKLIYYLLKYR